MNTCPLSMISGRPTECKADCLYCIPEDIQKISSECEYLECLNLPNDMFGTGLASDGLIKISDTLSEIASAITCS